MGKSLQLGLVQHSRTHLDTCRRHTPIFKSTLVLCVHSAINGHSHIIIQCHTNCTSRTKYICHDLPLYMPPSAICIMLYTCMLDPGLFMFSYVSVHITLDYLYHNRYLCTSPRAIYARIYAYTQGHSHIYWQKPRANTQVLLVYIYSSQIYTNLDISSPLCHSHFSLFHSTSPSLPNIHTQGI